MKIAIIGYSGSGKSTLARRLGEEKDLPVLHLDTLRFLPGWQVRPLSEQRTDEEAFLDGHSSWVIDGNYSQLAYNRRMAEADRIFLLDFPRRVCLPRVIRRQWQYRGKSRPDMTEGCLEKLDWEFLTWVLWRGRTKEKKALFSRLARQYPEKLIRFTRPWQVRKLVENIERGAQI